jgi:hypothetical protein
MTLPSQAQETAAASLSLKRPAAEVCKVDQPPAKRFNSRVSMKNRLDGLMSKYQSKSATAELPGNNFAISKSTMM